MAMPLLRGATRHARKELVGQVCHRAAFPPTRPAHRGLWASAGRDIRRDDAHSPARKKLCMKTPPAGQPPQRALHGTHLHAPFLPRDSPNACPRRPSRAVFSRAACLCLQRPSRFSADASSLRFSVLAFARLFAPAATARKAALYPSRPFLPHDSQTPAAAPAFFRFGVRAPICSHRNRAKGSAAPFRAPFLPCDSPNACPRHPSRFSALAFARPFAPAATARKAALYPSRPFLPHDSQTPAAAPALFRFGVRARRAKRARGCLRAPGSYVSCRIAAIPLFCGRPHICRPPDDGPAPAGGASAEPFDVPLASSAARRAAPALCSPGIIPQAVRAPRPPRVRRRRESARRFVLPPLRARAARFRKRA